MKEAIQSDHCIRLFLRHYPQQVQVILHRDLLQPLVSAHLTAKLVMTETFLRGATRVNRLEEL